MDRSEMYTEKWEGGYTRKDANGRRVYVIRKQWLGKRYTRSTGVHTLKAAMDQLKRFEADPEGYTPVVGMGPDGSSSRRQPLFLTEILSLEFLTYCAEDRGNGADWVRWRRYRESAADRSR